MTDQLTEVRVVTPPRCGARRPIRFGEWLLWKLLGKVRGFDPTEEARCNHYRDHADHGYPHEDPTGYRWSA